MENSIWLKELSDLREFGNRLLDSTSIEQVINEAFQSISNKLHPQVVSLFLFSKDGYLERFDVDGKDKNGILIDNTTWLPSEKYKPGESFSGKAAFPQPEHNYGDPNWSNSLERNIDKLTYGNIYAEKLGFLKCGISVPLNGSHRTFGTLEVINRVEAKTGQPNKELIFNEEDVYWLTIMGAHVASAISRLRKKDEEKIFAEISCMLADPNAEGTPPSSVYSSITKQLVGPLMPYKVCILRMTFSSALYPIEKACTNDINFEGKDEDFRVVGQGIVGEVLKTGTYIAVEDIEHNISRFTSYEWIKSKKLKSFICFPLVIESKVVGTLSLFTGYIHKFNDSDIEFLKNVSFLLAAYRVRIDRAKDGKEKEAEKDPLENSRIRGIDARQEILNSEGGCLSISEVTKKLGTSIKNINDLRSKRKLIGLNNSEIVYPKWQFVDDEILRDLDKIVTALGTDDPWMQASFMLYPNIWLEDKRPLDLLRKGKTNEVLAAANMFGKHGAA